MSVQTPPKSRRRKDDDDDHHPLINLKEIDLFKSDKSTIDAQKIVIALWQQRETTNCRDIVDIFSMFIDEQRVVNEVEFYLPQILHLIIHIENESAAKQLEMFISSLCQVSVHIALQIYFLLNASLEDYQPENSTGQPNPKYSRSLFRRCAKLLAHVQRAVYYGSPVLTIDGQARIQKQALLGSIMEVGDYVKNEMSSKISLIGERDANKSTFSGFLLYKRASKKSIVGTKSWKPRFFQVSQQILYCYKSNDDGKNAVPIRAIILPLFKVQVVTVGKEYKHPFTFILYSKSSSVKYMLRAPDKATMNEWVYALDIERVNAPTPVAIPFSLPISSTNIVSVMYEIDGVNIDIGYMSPVGIKRFLFFNQQRYFIQSLSDISEKLRTLERGVRKHFLKRDLATLTIPPFAYIPLCRSIDVWESVVRAVPSESRAFNTKARCPCLMIFEVLEHPEDSSVAAFIGSELHHFEDKDIYAHKVQQHDEEGEDGLLGHDHVDDGHEQEEHHDDEKETLIHFPSPFTARAPNAQIGEHFKPVGTGMARFLKSIYSLSQRSNEKSKTPPLPSFTKPRTFASPESGSSGGGGGFMSPSTGASGPSSPGFGVGSSKLPFMPSLIAGTPIANKSEKLQRASPYGHLPGWKLDGLICKSNDDVRQEMFVMQLLCYYQKAFQLAKVPVWLHTYKILPTSKSTGLIQIIPNAASLDDLKKSPDWPGSLRAHFEKIHGYVPGQPEPPSMKVAIKNFVKSMAAYSVICYLLGIKDRHNGNIMLDSMGHIIHIDYAFVFGLAPGKQFSVEQAPFKLTKEMVEVMGGDHSPLFEDFHKKLVQAFMVCRRHAAPVQALIEIMQYKSQLPCFAYNRRAVEDFKTRLLLNVEDNKVEEMITRLTISSLAHSGTDLYDIFQKATNNIEV